MSAPRIALRGVGRTYHGRRGDVPALTGVDLEVADGELVSVVGRSGCGKSTLLKVVAGLVPATTGTVQLGGRAVDGPPGEVRYVFQDFGQSLLPWRSAADNVLFGLQHASPGADPLPSGRSRRRQLAREHLDRVGLLDVADRYPGELSGGMQQRLAIARALASRPSVLLLDEPFSAVDALSRAALQDELLRLWTELGLTVVFVTHDVDEAAYLSDRVVVLDEGGRGVAAEVDVPLGRPRTQVATREEPAYLAVRRELFRHVLSRASDPAAAADREGRHELVDH